MQHDVQITDTQRAQLDALPEQWTAFQAVVDEATGSLEQAKENFQEKVRGMVDVFGSEVTQLTDAFATVAPFSSEGFDAASVRPVSCLVHPENVSGIVFFSLSLCIAESAPFSSEGFVAASVCAVHPFYP